MKRTGLTLISLLMCSIMMGQTARSVLDKIAATVSNRTGVTANFSISDGKAKSLGGTISVKGKMFHATTTQADVWFDGKTQWTYMKGNNEVNVSTPTESELQAINPYNFINIYKTGFKYSMKNQGNNCEIHLTATDSKRKLQEIYIYANRSTYVPSQIKMKQGTRWNVITISNFRKAKLNDNMFRFNRKTHPEAEIIDLR